jgi:prolyl-tRNA editing enzyme YbaK/EbsC (Cys-tRNA(Pro) deacylase)
VDPRVLEKDVVYLGGGSDMALVRMGTSELVRANGGRVVRVRR